MDYSQQNNTVLSPDEEAQFQAWAVKSNKLKDLYDYDLRGLWKLQNGQLDSRGHGTDQFKKPNHPTFSNESMYSKGDAGVWTTNPDGTMAFTPGPSNQWSRPELKNYFKKVEPGVNLFGRK